MNVLATNPGNPAWKLGTHIEEGKNWSSFNILSSGLCQPPAALIPHTINNEVNKI